eukprot:650443-Prorocentrum_minimum.AAC.1
MCGGARGDAIIRSTALCTGGCALCSKGTVYEGASAPGALRRIAPATVLGRGRSVRCGWAPRVSYQTLRSVEPAV